MATYVTLWRYTREGLMDIRNTTKRFEAVKGIVEKNGGELLQVYGMVGEFNVLTIMRMPDEKALTSAIYTICASGRVTAQTLPAMPIEEFLTITKDV